MMKDSWRGERQKMKLISELMNDGADTPRIESRMDGGVEKFKLTLAGLVYCLQLLCAGKFITFNDLPEVIGDDVDENLARFTGKMKVKQLEINDAVNQWLGVVK